MSGEEIPNKYHSVLTIHKRDEVFDHLVGRWRRKVYNTDLFNENTSTVPASTVSSTLIASTTDAYTNVRIYHWAVNSSTACWFALVNGTSTIDRIYNPSSGIVTKNFDEDNPLCIVSESSTISVVAVTPLSASHTYSTTLVGKKEPIIGSLET